MGSQAITATDHFHNFQEKLFFNPIHLLLFHNLLFDVLPISSVSYANSVSENKVHDNKVLAWNSSLLKLKYDSARTTQIQAIPDYL